MDRNLTPELMDDPALDPARHGQALRGLARLNRVSGADRIPWHAIRDWARGSHGPFTLLDVATGSGDVPLGLAARARRAGLELRLHGCDVSPVALEHARERSHRAGVSFECIVQDAVHEPFTRRFDVVTCNLFLHHLDEADAVSLLRNAAAACSGLLLVSDLRRDPAGLLLAAAGSRALSRSPVVHVDAVKSVRAAWTPAELAGLARRAGLEGFTIGRRFPRRMLLEWRCPR
ncbi:MAG: methyltransferase domain-containing protein [Planctomycetota bacterium]|nr:methyltransferase domain-containing protein [Planctomycetota bacterium]